MPFLIFIFIISPIVLTIIGYSPMALLLWLPASVLIRMLRLTGVSAEGLIGLGQLAAQLETHVCQSTATITNVNPLRLQYLQ